MCSSLTHIENRHNCLGHEVEPLQPRILDMGPDIPHHFSHSATLSAELITCSKISSALKYKIGRQWVISRHDKFGHFMGNLDRFAST